MKNLYNYISEFLFEGKFSGGDFHKHNYLNDVIDTLCNKSSIRLGANGEKTLEIDPKIQPELKQAFDDAARDLDLKKFNSIMKSFGLPEWTKIFKGDFSGYTDGLASKNRGNAFEVDFVNNFEYYAEDFSKCCGVDVEELLDATIDLTGGNNSKRPLKISNSGITVGDIRTSGDLLADVVINTKNKINTSLKFGPKVTFINAGVKPYFPEKSFSDYKETGKYIATKEGQMILDFFGLEAEKFANVFVNYTGDETGKRSKSEKEEVDVTDIAKRPEFYEFLMSVVGCNYILVHKVNNKRVNYYDLTTPDNVKKFIGNIEKMVIEYPIDGKKKAVDITLDTTGLNLKFNFRNKQGGVNPNQLMADYKIKH